MDAELTFRSYKPLSLEKGMWFINKINPNTFKELITITVLDKIPQDEEAFLQTNGYPVEPYIVYENHVLATPQQIAWFDEDPDAEFMSDVTIDQLQVILNEYDGWLDIQMEDCEDDDDECQATPVIMEGKVIISYLMEEEYWEDDWEEGDGDEDEEEEIDWQIEIDDDDEEQN